MVFDLAEVPALDGRHESDPDNQRKADRFPSPPRQQEFVFAGVEDVHGCTISSASDKSGPWRPRWSGAGRHGGTKRRIDALAERLIHVVGGRA